MSAGYILAYVDVTDPAQYEQYKVLSSRAMQAHGAEALVRGGKTEVLEASGSRRASSCSSSRATMPPRRSTTVRNTVRPATRASRLPA